MEALVFTMHYLSHHAESSSATFSAIVPRLRARDAAMIPRPGASMLRHFLSDASIYHEVSSCFVQAISFYTLLGRIPGRVGVASRYFDDAAIYITIARRQHCRRTNDF